VYRNAQAVFIEASLKVEVCFFEKRIGLKTTRRKKGKIQASFF